MRILPIATLCLLSTTLLAQRPRKSLYFQLGGNGIAFNVMYESRFKPGNGGAGFKVGAGGFSSSNGYETIFTLPVGVNWLLSKDDKHFFEAGFGATFIHYKYNYENLNRRPSEEYPEEIAGLTLESKNSVYGHMTLGYRHQPPTGGIMWGAAITPHFNHNGFWPLWVGLKFGYSFPNNAGLTK
jgi:hypothetical protein